MQKKRLPISIRQKIAGLIFFLVLAAAIITFFIYKSVGDYIIAATAAVAITTVIGIFVSKLIANPIQKDVEQSGQQLKSKLVAIKSDRDKMRTMLQQMADGMIAIDAQGRILHANDAARTMLHMSEEDAKYKSYDDIILRFSDDLTQAAIAKMLDEGVTEGGFSYGGATYDVRFDHFTNTAGEIRGHIILFQDVTERKKFDNMQIDFVANVSHELKTPLTSIKGYTETLLSGGVEDEDMRTEFLSIIQSETDRMNRLVKDILQMSRLDTQNQKWDMVENDIVNLVRIAIKKIDMTAKEKNQQLNAIFKSDEVIMIEMDRDKIEQVVLNILSNAIKYTKEEGRIDVDIIKGDDTASVIIMDNGIGIPESVQSRVFERFFRVDKARSGKVAGTGLGLSISKQIVEVHGGRIDLESWFGKGTKVTITLPIPRIRGKRNIL